MFLLAEENRHLENCKTTIFQKFSQTLGFLRKLKNILASTFFQTFSNTKQLKLSIFALLDTALHIICHLNVVVIFVGFLLYFYTLDPMRKLKTSTIFFIIVPLFRIQKCNFPPIIILKSSIDFFGLPQQAYILPCPRQTGLSLSLIHIQMCIRDSSRVQQSQSCHLIVLSLSLK